MNTAGKILKMRIRSRYLKWRSGTTLAKLEYAISFHRVAGSHWSKKANLVTVRYELLQCPHLLIDPISPPLHSVNTKKVNRKWLEEDSYTWNNREGHQQFNTLSDRLCTSAALVLRDGPDRWIGLLAAADSSSPAWYYNYIKDKLLKK